MTELEVRAAPRRDRLRAADPGVADLVDRLLAVAGTGLPGMQLPDGLSCYTRRFSATGIVAPPEGWSLRYTAVTALGARHLPGPDQRRLLAGRTAAEKCALLVDRLSSVDFLGDAALVLWAVAECAPDLLDRALERVAVLDADDGPRFVVSLAWTLSALVAARGHADVEAPIARTRDRLLAALGSGRLFGHATGPGLTPAYRRHIGSFSAQAYPIQALARLHASAPDPVALVAASRCAEQLCALQGPAGQWWWHYDARTGGVVEGYPVYSVNQHALAPTALLDLADAGGYADPAAIARGLGWLTAPAEVDAPLILDAAGVTVRKVGRGRPRKLVRGLRAAATSVRPGSRLPAVEVLWPATRLDRETRPYELAWLLDCWLGGR